MLQKWKMALVLAGTFYCGNVLALKLDQMTLRSSLGQPLQAVISLKDTSGVGAEQISASPGSERDYKRAGRVMSPFLEKLKFRTVEDKAGNPQIEVYSKEAVNEPFISFLLEVKWPKGKVLREYTILLDPPAFGTRTVERKDQDEMPDSEVGKTESGSDFSATTYQVKPDENLWEIARLFASSRKMSDEQMMELLVKRNPHAFIDGKPDKLIKHATLVIPEGNSQTGEKVEPEPEPEVMDGSDEQEHEHEQGESDAVRERFERLQTLSRENMRLASQLELFEKKISSLKKAIDEKEMEKKKQEEDVVSANDNSRNQEADLTPNHEEVAGKTESKVTEHNEMTSNAQAEEVMPVALEKNADHAQHIDRSNDRVKDDSVENKKLSVPYQDSENESKELTRKTAPFGIESVKKPVASQDWFHMIFGNFYNFLLAVFGALFVIAIGWYLEKRRRQRQEEKEMDAILEREAREEESAENDGVVPGKGDAERDLSVESVVFSEMVKERGAATDDAVKTDNGLSVENPDSDDILAGEHFLQDQDVSNEKTGSNESGSDHGNEQKRVEAELSPIGNHTEASGGKSELLDAEVSQLVSESIPDSLTADQDQAVGEGELQLLEDEDDLRIDESIAPVMAERTTTSADTLSDEADFAVPETDTNTDTDHQHDVTDQLEHLDEEISALSQEFSATGEMETATLEESEDEQDPVDEDNSSIPSLLDLARAYLEMDDKEEARDILKRVLQKGDSSQQDEARRLLDRCQDG